MTNKKNFAWMDSLNSKQQEAVITTEGPLLVLAGAGSGKTRVITCRTAYLIESGVAPDSIMALTFTNKAAKEMQQRIISLCHAPGKKVFVSTFHSACLNILKKHAVKLGFHSKFSIYDSDDQKNIVKDLLKQNGHCSNASIASEFVDKFSHAKNHMLLPDDPEIKTFLSDDVTISLYKQYQESLINNQAMDFNDLLLYTIRLFEERPDILSSYQEKYHYIMVDEYQDTNHAQFKFIELLSRKKKNLCVVGDDDQSIYGWRDADVQNILQFPSVFPGAKIVKLEQNYRSTKKILNAANAVISHNQYRMEKSLWTENQEGDNLRFRRFETEKQEASFLAEEAGRHKRLSDVAIICRTAAPLNLLGGYMERRNIPYITAGGMCLYDYKEIKDILSYLKAISNRDDVTSLKRAIASPKRGIGNSAFGKIVTFSIVNGISVSEAYDRVGEITSLGKKAIVLETFMDMMNRFRKFVDLSSGTITELVENVVKESGILEDLKKTYFDNPDEYEKRKEHISLFKERVTLYSNAHDPYDLGNFLSHVALVTSQDPLDSPNGKVTLMTAHTAKGLEFKHVYICGLEDGHFPHGMCNDEEEERRLFYVGITRAMETLTLTCADSRWNKFFRPSCFLEELPVHILSK